MELKNSETLKNLTRAFAAECQDGAKYQYMADEATQQKMSYVSSVLKQLATNEMAHAKIFYDYVAQNSGVEDLTVEIKASYPMAHAPLEQMLKIKADNEKKQAQVVYPAFAKTAINEGFLDIAEQLEKIAKIEAVHAMVLQELYDKISNGNLYACDKCFNWKCNNCGFEQETKKAWKKCPLCCKDQGYVRFKLCGCGDDCGSASEGMHKQGIHKCGTKKMD